MRKMQADALLSNGDVFSGERISKLTGFIINKLAEEGLNYEESQIILSATSDEIKIHSKVVNE